MRERELFEISGEINHAALDFVKDKAGLGYASIMNRSGLLKHYTHRCEEAINCFKAALSIREELLGPDHSLVAWTYNNIGLSYTELGRLDEAYHYLGIGLEKRRKSDTSCIGNSYSNLASLSLKMGRPDEAEKYLFSCPSLQNLSDGLLLQKNNPRFAGDMVLLSRIRRSQGRSDDALRLASKALAYRRRLLGNRFTTCDSMHDVATLLMEHQKYETALSMLQDLVSLAESSLGPTGLGQLARGYYRLSILHGLMGDSQRTEECQRRALDLVSKLLPDQEKVLFEEQTFSRLCPWMLW